MRLLKRTVSFLCAAAIIVGTFTMAPYTRAEEPLESALPDTSATAVPIEPTVPPAATPDETVLRVDCERSRGERVTATFDKYWRELSIEVLSEKLGAAITAEEGNTLVSYSAKFDLDKLAYGDVVLLELPGTSFQRRVFVNGTEVLGKEELSEKAYGEKIEITDLLKSDDSDFSEGTEDEAAATGVPAAEENYNEIIVILEGSSEQAEPRLVDSTGLIISGRIFTERVETRYDLESGTLFISANVKNYSSFNRLVTLEITVYELGVVVDGVSSTRNGTGFVSTEISIPAGGTVMTEEIAVGLRNFDSKKYWSPENPYLYEVEVRTPNDIGAELVGMREFTVAGEDRSYPTLNGEPYFMSGATVDFSKYTGENAGKLDSALDRLYVKSLFESLKKSGMTVIKSENGLFPMLWYDLADECGMLLVAEYKLEGGNSLSTERLQAELTKVMQQLYNHPSVIIWDLGGTAEQGSLAAELVSKLKEVDRQERPFDCGFMTAPASEGDLIECNVSEIGSTEIIENGEFKEEAGGVIYYPEKLSWNMRDYGNPKIITNFGNEKYTKDELSLLTEYLRVQRRFAGLLVSLDVLTAVCGAGAVNAMNPLGLVIEYYPEAGGRGDKLSFDVAVLNDTGKDVNDLDVTLVLKSGEDVLYTAVQSYDTVKKYGTDSRDIARRRFDIEIPAYINDNTDTVIEASFVLDGKVVSCKRSFTVKGGVPYESPLSTVFVVGAVGSCLLLVGSATVIAFGRLKRNNTKSSGKMTSKSAPWGKK